MDVLSGFRRRCGRVKRKLEVAVCQHSLSSHKKLHKIWRRAVCLQPISVHEYCVKKEGSHFSQEGAIRYLSHEASMEYVSKPRSAKSGIQAYESIEKFPDYVANLKDVAIIPNSDVLIKGHYLMSDYLAYNYEGTLLALGPNHLAHDRTRAIVKLEKKKAFLDKALFFGHWGANNLWHLMFDILARMRFFDAVQEFSSWPILIDGKVKEQQWASELLGMVNQRNHPVCYIEPGTTYYVKQIAACPLSYLYIPEQGNDKFIVSKESIGYIRNQALSGLPAQGSEKTRKGQCFYIYRGDGRLANEDALADRLREKGIEIIKPELLGLQDEIRLFANAELIIGAIGAGLSNTIFCKEGCKIVCISVEARSGLAAAYAQIADVTGAQLWAVFADLIEDSGCGTPGMKFLVDIKEVVDAIEKDWNEQDEYIDVRRHRISGEEAHEKVGKEAPYSMDYKK